MVKSFTEMAYINPFYLNTLSSPNCEKMPIKTSFHSAVETLDTFNKEIFDNPTKTSIHYYTKPLRMVARIVYSVAVATIVAPLGTVFNGGRAIVELSKYAFFHYSKNQVKADAAWLKVKEVATALFTDLTTFLMGLGFCILTGLSVFAVTNPISIRALSSAGFVVGMLTLLTQSHSPDYYVSGLVAPRKNKVGMFISMALFNRLGICDNNGGLLPFNSAKDKIDLDYTQKTYTGNAQKKLYDIIKSAEKELLDAVKEANNYLAKNFSEIPFQYPVDGNAASIVLATMKPKKTGIEKADSLALDVINPTPNLVKRLHHLQRKITILRGIYKDAVNISSDFPPQMTILVIFTKQRAPTALMTPSTMNEDEYRDYFEDKYRDYFEAYNYDYDALFLSSGFSGVSPEVAETIPYTNEYDKFKLRVREVIWYLENNIEGEPSLDWVLGLEDTEFTKEIFRKRFKELSLIVSPDKNLGRVEEAGRLTRILNNLKDALENTLK